MMTHDRLSRRDLLKAGGALDRQLRVRRGAAPMGAGADAAPAATPASRSIPARSTASSRFIADGTVTVYTGKVDVGTGLRIAVAQMAAEELGVRAERITRRRRRHRPLSGSGRHRRQHGPDARRRGSAAGRGDRAAGAARRSGAARLNRPAAELTIVDGEVRPVAGGAGRRHRRRSSAIAGSR